MKKIEIIDKNITMIKLTVAVNRISIKFPLNTPKSVKDTVTFAFLIIAEINQDTQHTLRGDLRENNIIRLCMNRRHQKPRRIAGVYYHIDNLLDARPVSSSLLQ